MGFGGKFGAGTERFTRKHPRRRGLGTRSSTDRHDRFLGHDDIYAYTDDHRHCSNHRDLALMFTPEIKVDGGAGSM